MKLLIENWRTFMAEEKDTKISCKVLIQDPEGKVFLVRMTGFDMWDIPGGHAHSDEDFADAGTREVKEETNLDILNLTKIGEYDTNKHYADKHIFFLSKDYSGDIKLQMKEVDEFVWVNPDELGDRKVSPEVTRAIEFSKVMEETIKKVDGKYAVYPKKGGKRLGTHGTEEAAKKQLAAIEISKHKKGS
jgi:8-oxo-dGTP pyrophosphatase MutT (NUDIX family)